MDSVVLTLNAGSSSLKFAAFRLVNGSEPNLLASGQIEGIGATAKGEVTTAAGETDELDFQQSQTRVDHTAAMGSILHWLKKAGYNSLVAAVGHRIVHGGPDYAEPVLIDGPTLAKLKALVPLAPLHQSHNVAGVEAAMKAFPSTPQVACFDTAFHRSHPFIHDTYALPRSYYDEGVRRYGFHGLSYEFIVRKLRAIAPQIAREDVIIAHLGNGASMCAVHAAAPSRRQWASPRSMAYRWAPAAVSSIRRRALSHGGKENERRRDIRSVVEELGTQGHVRLVAGHAGARGVDHSSSARRHRLFRFAHPGRAAGLAATVDGAEAIVFTAGIGEHSWRVREGALKGMEWMGIHLDAHANRANAEIISAPSSPTIVFVIPTNEELMIAEHTVATARVRK